MTRWLGSPPVAWLTAVLAIGAVGAAWALLAMLARQPLPWLALPMAVAAVFAGRSLGLGTRWATGLATCLLAAGGTAYAQALAATDRLARMLGRGFFETAIAAGPEMIAALVWARLDGLAQITLLGGPLLAGAWAARRGGTARGPAVRTAEGPGLARARR